MDSSPSLLPVGVRRLRDADDAAEVPVYRGVSYCDAVRRAGATSPEGGALRVLPGSIKVCHWSPVVLGLKRPEDAFERKLAPCLPYRPAGLLLAPLDGSDFSECSLAHVKAIASGCNVPEVVLMRVIEPMPQTGWIGQDAMVEADKKAHEHAKEYLDRVSNDLKEQGLYITTAIVDGRPGDVIMEYAEKNQVDLVIMSTHGSSGVARWAFGSVTDKVVRHSKVPVLITSPAACRVS